MESLNVTNVCQAPSTSKEIPLAFLTSVRTLKPEFQLVNQITLQLPIETLGRALSNRIIIPHIGISRLHCQFRKQSDESWSILDYSMVGIKINGESIPKRVYVNLKDDDILKLDFLGEFTYAFKQNQNFSTGELNNSQSFILETDTENKIQILRDDFECSQNFEKTNMETKLRKVDEEHDAIVNEKLTLQIKHNNKLAEMGISVKKRMQEFKGSLVEIEMQKTELLLKAEKEKEALEIKLRGAAQILEEKMSGFQLEKEKLLEDNKMLLVRLQNEKDMFEKRLAEVTNFKEQKVEILQKQLEDKDKSITEEKEHMEKKFLEDVENLKNNMELELKDFKTRAYSDIKEKSDKIELLQSQIKTHEESLSKNILIEKENQTIIDEMKTKLRNLKWEKDEEVSKYAIKYGALERAKKEAEEELISKYQAELARMNEHLENFEEFKTKLAHLEERLKHELQSKKILENKLEMSEKRNTRKRTRSQVENENQAMYDTQRFTDDFNRWLEPELVCAICSDIFIDAVTLNCGHSYCNYCINQWNEKSKACPSCRCDITSKIQSIVLNSVISSMVLKLSSSAKEQREEVIKFRKQKTEEKLIPEKKKRSAIDSQEFYGSNQVEIRITRSSRRTRRRR